MATIIIKNVTGSTRNDGLIFELKREGYPEGSIVEDVTIRGDGKVCYWGGCVAYPGETCEVLNEQEEHEALKMVCKSILYQADGAPESIVPANKKEFTAKELQKLVGGYTELILLANGQVMVINKEAAIDELPVNMRASEILKKHGKDATVQGTVLVCPSSLIR